MLSEISPYFIEKRQTLVIEQTPQRSRESSLKIDLRPVLGEGIPILSTFLRKNQRALKLSTLACLDVLVVNYGSALTSTMINEMKKEMPSLINENDLHVLQLTLTLLTYISKSHKTSIANVPNEILPQILILIQSPLLQGGALLAMLDFFQTIVGLPKLTFKDLLQLLIKPIYAASTPSSHSIFTIHKQSPSIKLVIDQLEAFHSIAKCVAVLTVMSPDEANNVVNQFVNDVKNQKSTDSIRLFSLLTLGEIWKHF